MNIVYDHQIFAGQRYGGISRYFFELASSINQSNKHNVKILAPLYVNEYIKDSASIEVIGSYVPKIRGTTKAIKILDTSLVRQMLYRIKTEIVHETYYSRSRIAPKGAATVVTVYDMIHELFRQYFSDKDNTSTLKDIAVKRADYVICISENTRVDLLNHIDIDPNKVAVVHLGYALNGVASSSADSYIKEPFILYVGERGGYKNFSSLLKAFAGSSRIRRDFKLVCFGGGTFRADEKEAMKREGLIDHQVVQMSGDDNILATLYSNASAFIYPSLYEGFGIPLLEAMSYRCPVICSNRSSFPEVAGNAAKYFEPEDISNMADTIETVLFSEEESKTLIGEGQNRIELFSWNKCAEQTIDIYSRLLGK